MGMVKKMKNLIFNSNFRFYYKILATVSRVKRPVPSQNNQNCGTVWSSVEQCGAELVLHIQLITIS